MTHLSLIYFYALRENLFLAKVQITDQWNDDWPDDREWIGDKWSTKKTIHLMQSLKERLLDPI